MTKKPEPLQLRFPRVVRNIASFAVLTWFANHYLYLLVLELEPLNKIPHIQVSNTAFHQSNVPARAPDATAVGNTTGMIAGQIQYTIVPPNRAINPITIIPNTAAPTTLITLSMFLFLV